MSLFNFLKSVFLFVICLFPLQSQFAVLEETKVEDGASSRSQIWSDDIKRRFGWLSSNRLLPGSAT